MFHVRYGFGQRTEVAGNTNSHQIFNFCPMSRAQYWVFTLNNYTEDELTFINNLITNPSFAYVSYGKEVGEQGTPHLQGHLELHNRLRLNQLKDLLFPRVHLEVRRGSFEQAEEYCQKDGDFYSFGERVSRGTGKRTDLDDLAQEIRQGTRKRVLAESFGPLFIKYSKGIENYYNMFACQRYEIFHGPFRWSHNFLFDRSIILWGEAGIGKTEYAKYLLPKALFVSHMDDLGSFNEDYDGIIFDDMDFRHLPRSAQIHITDVDNNRSIHIRYKIASIPAHTKKIFLTNVFNGEIFDINDAAINRRLQIIHLE